MISKLSPERLTSSLARVVEHWKQQRGVSGLRAQPLAGWTVAISRETGARGSSIAQRVGELLGWHCYDRDLLQKIADEKGLRVQLLESVDEKHASWLQFSLEGVMTGPHVSETAFVRYVAETLFSLSALGECVIVGRGAAMILPPATTFRVRLIGLEKDRVAYIGGHFGLSEKDAAHWVRQTDHDRNHFAQEFFHKNPTDLHEYDLVINTSRFSNEVAAELIVQGLKQLAQK
jgi:cytidylate kinase